MEELHRVDSDAENVSAAVDDDFDELESSATYSEDDDHDEQAHDMAFPHLPRGVPMTARFCSTCAGASTRDIDNDNGVFVTNHQRKMWEKWVVHRRNKG